MTIYLLLELNSLLSIFNTKLTAKSNNPHPKHKKWLTLLLEFIPAQTQACFTTSSYIPSTTQHSTNLMKFTIPCLFSPNILIKMSSVHATSVKTVPNPSQNHSHPPPISPSNAKSPPLKPLART